MMPRTTIDIDGSVLRDLKQRQRREGKTLGALVSELLAAALAQDEEGTRGPVPFEWASQRMLARVDLDDTEAVQHALDHTP